MAPINVMTLLFSLEMHSPFLKTWFLTKEFSVVLCLTVVVVNFRSVLIVFRSFTIVLSGLFFCAGLKKLPDPSASKTLF